MNTLNYIKEMISILVNIPSPTGYSDNIMNYIKNEVETLGCEFQWINKGGAIITIKGKSDEILGLSAHVDTLGAMVRSIKSSGKLKLTMLGGFTMESIEGSYCKVHTRDNREYEGTILSISPSVHVYDDARTLKREEENMEVRIDERVFSKEEVEALGIQVGDYVSFDPNCRILENGYIKSRHLDDKASVAILLGYAYDLYINNKLPAKTIKIFLSNYEEIGHGASFIPPEIEELIAVDMAAVGKDLNGSEHKVSICAKDSTGPYDYKMTSKLINIAKQNNLEYAIDIYPHYGSDVSAALRGGNNIKGALIGPGVHASHGMERTHEEGLINTLRLIQLYVES